MRDFLSPRVTVAMVMIAALGLSWRVYESRFPAIDISGSHFSEMTQFTEDTVLVKPEDEKKKQDFRNMVRPFIIPAHQIIPIKVFEENYDAFGPQIMIDVLNEDRSCHSQAHFLGRVIYAHTQDLTASLAVCQSKCNSGCIHGALMEMFHAPLSDTDPSVKAVTPEIQREIADTCRKTEVAKYTGIGNCYHALGHVIDSLVEDDIPAALDLCRSIFKPEGISAIYYCATGVYMQQNITSGAAYAAGSDRLAPCDSNAYPAACYRYKIENLFKLPSEYTQAQSMCLSLAGAQQRGCFHALGFRAADILANDPKALGTLCGMGDDLDKQMCVEGALGIIKTLKTYVPSAICENYTGDKSMCQTAAMRDNFTMERDFELYAQ